MKLFIYDKFWDAFLRINKGTQAKITEFISKFRTNPKSAALNLEAINTFKDPSLKTARIDQKIPGGAKRSGSRRNVPAGLGRQSRRGDGLGQE